MASTAAVESGGMRATFADDAIVHCVAAEPETTIVRVSVTDHGQEVAYETAILSRLRNGYRVLQLRGLLGTRIELCLLLIRVTVGSHRNLWNSSRQMRLQIALERQRLREQRVQAEDRPS